MLLVLYFTASWCGPCKMFGPIVSQVQSKVPNVNISKVDVDASVNSQLVTTYNVTSVPTLIFVKDGVQVFRKSGIMTEQELLSTINKYS